MKIELCRIKPPLRDWPKQLPAAPHDLVEILKDAMIDFGPDGHCDGAKEIAAIVLNWMRANTVD